MARSLELPYKAATRCEDRYAWFDAIRPLGWPVFLDSGDPARSGGRYDILAAAPSAVTTSREGAFAAARALIADESASGDGWPVSGAVIGYLGYELGRAVAGLPPAKADAAAFMPEAALGLYPWTVVVDHVERRAALTSLDSFPLAQAEALRDRLLASTARPLRAFSVDAPVASTLERDAYLPRARRVLDYIEAGDCYQANLTREFRAPCAGDPWTFYRRLHDVNPAPMGAYLEYPFGAVLSSSPERLLEVERSHVQTRPIKGTRRRQADPSADAAAAAQLLASEKDRAENVMIVDLLRNDLGKVAVPGSVHVSSLFDLECFETVWQMTSTVEATLKEGTTLVDLMTALFPCGSITGAPKIRTMQIIRELERFPRGPYTGTIGFLKPNGDCTFNVAIRTVVIDTESSTATFGVGGGVTIDSTADREYEECLVKARFLIRQ